MSAMEYRSVEDSESESFLSIPGFFSSRMEEMPGFPPLPHTVMPQSSCQDLILASPYSNPVAVMNLRVEAAMDADAGRYQAQALV